VIVATSHDELPRLHALLDRGRRNGVPGLRLLDQDSLLEVEPHVRALAAIHSPTTAVVDFSRVCDALAADLHTSGHAIALGCEVSSVRRDRDGLTLAYGDGEARAKFALFCTGSWSDRLAPPDREVRIIPFRGQYFSLRYERRWLVRGLVYPVPDPALPFLGVHLTRHIDDTVSIGPSALLAGAYDAYSVRAIRARDLRAIATWPGTYRLLWRYRRHVVTELGHTLSKRAVVRAAARMLPDLAPADVVRAEAGVRGQAVTHAGRLLDDFVFTESDRALHVRSAPSPAATEALAIADYVAARCERSWSV
jgi:2-hydroxyglutarate dehydrogenase